MKLMMVKIIFEVLLVPNKRVFRITLPLIRLDFGVFRIFYRGQHRDFNIVP